MRDERDAYSVLRVEPGAGEDAVRTAYRVLARRNHPDGEVPDPVRMIEINVAYDQLKTRERRARYDMARRPMVAVGPGIPGATTPGMPAGPLARRRAAGGDEDCTVIDFGRYAGWRIVDLAQFDPDYLRWLSRHSTGIRYRASIERCLPGDKDIGRRAAWVR